MQKVCKSMKSSQKYPLEKLIYVDEFTVEGKQGRSYDSKKKKAVISVELTDNNKAKRVYRVIPLKKRNYIYIKHLQLVY